MITDTLSEFNGDFDTVGSTYRVGTFNFTVPLGSSILSATLSGTYGNSGVPNSSPVDLTLAGGVFVNSCNNACVTNQTPTPWSTNLNVTAIPNFDLGTASLNATQTGDYVIRLGPTMLTVTLSLSPAQQFYNNNVIPVSNELNKIAEDLKLAAIDASIAGAAELIPPTPLFPNPVYNPAEGAENLTLEAEMLTETDDLDKFPSADDLIPYVDPPLTLPTVSPTGGFTGTMIAQFTQLEQNLSSEIADIATLTQLGSQIQLGLSQNTDATTYINSYQALLASLSHLSQQNSTLYSELQAELAAASLNVSISQSDIQAFIASLTANGFPSEELSVFDAFGVTPDQILSDILAGGFSGAPTSLVDAFSSAALSESKISEVTGSIPEPATWAMMLLGFAGLGFAGFRRRSTASLA